MSNRDKPAFPSADSQPFGWQVTGELPKKIQGLTKREYFAGLAMQGLCADPNNHDLFSSIEHAAQNAVAIADAILAELERAK